MIRLIHGIGKNESKEYDRIYKERAKKDADKQDVKRWKKMLKYYRGGRLLDVGALDSMIPVFARSKYQNAEAYAVDVAEEAVTEMRRKYPGVHYEVGDVYKLRFENSYFDDVFLGEILEHLENPGEAIKEAMRVLKPDGVCVVSVPLNEAKEPGAVDGDRHIWSFDEKDMREILGKYGEIVDTEVIGSQYFPKYVYKWPTLITFCRKK